MPGDVREAQLLGNGVHAPGPLLLPHQGAILKGDPGDVRAAGPACDLRQAQSHSISLEGETGGVAAASAVLLQRLLRLDHQVGVRVVLEQPHPVAVVVSLLGEKQGGHRVVWLQLDQSVAVVAGGSHGVG